VPAELLDSIEKEQTAIASIRSVLDKGDMTLIAAAKNGNHQAFEVLVNRHARRLFFVALRVTRNREDAEDIVQRSLQKTFVHLHSFVGRSSFSTWLTRVAINEALMLLRKNRGSREVLIDDLNGDDGTAISLEVADSTPDPEASYSQRESVGMLCSAMNELTPGTRKAFQLRELDERSTEETARILGISVNAVKARLFHGRRKLRERLKRLVEPSWTSGGTISRTIGSTRHVSQGHAACNPCGYSGDEGRLS
jgi:RNA polymerase sigma-70 factor (ECF subfamily)